VQRRLTVAALGALAALGGGVAASTAATTPDPQAASDAKGDVRSTLDLTRLSLARGADGRLRASMTLAAAWDGKDLLSDAGPPGSLCLKLWTTTAPPDTTPDRLVCVTAGKDGSLRGSLLKARPNKLPERTGSAEVSRPSGRTVTVRFAQSAIGRPALLYVAAEATRPGCLRGSCIDLAPDAPQTLQLQLRTPTASTGGR
jgi:hypothetical protein